MLTDDLTELVITLTGYKVDLELMPTAREAIVFMLRGNEMYAIYTAVYDHSVLH